MRWRRVDGGRIYGEETIDPETLREGASRRKLGARPHRRSLVLGACALAALVALALAGAISEAMGK